MNYVSVRLRDSYGGYSDKHFTFKTHMDLQPDDIVIVDAANDVHIGIVTDKEPDKGLKYYKYVLAKIEREKTVQFLKRLEASE